MRQGIFKEENGVLTIDIQKALGKSYNNGWFTNTKNCRYRLFKGARNTKKSYDILGYEPIIRMVADDITNILVIRRYDVDNRNSTFANLLRAISDLGLEKYFKTRTQPLEIEYIDGRKIMFAGMNNPTSLNSIACKKGFLTCVYIEEAYEIESWDAFVKLDQSIRAGMGYDQDGNLVELDVPQQITMCFNAWSDQTWLYTEFFKGRLEDDFEYLETHKYADYKDESFVGPGGTGLYLHISTYKCNEFRNRKQVDMAAKEMKEKNPDYYRTLFLGCWGAATSTTYPEFTNACIVTEQQIRDDFTFMDFAIGIDTGLSAGDGKKIIVHKNEDVATRVKAATVMILGGITPGYGKAIAIDEYYHSNDSAFNVNNTDNRDNLNIQEQANAIINTIISWMNKYGEGRKKRGDILMKGRINVYIDSADIGFRQVMEMTARKYGLYNIDFIASTKTPIQGRVDWERLMFSYQDLLISEKCPNLIREFKNSRKGKKGEARENLDDHAINSFEYELQPFRNDFVSWKNNFKEH